MTRLRPLFRASIIALSVVSGLAACGDDSSRSDGGTPDASLPDSTTPDAGAPDGTVPDSSTPADSSLPDSAMTDGGSDGAADGSADAGDGSPDASAGSLSIEWVASIGSAALPGVAVEIFDVSDLGTVIGTGTSDASGVSAITFTSAPAGAYVAHAVLAGNHDTYFYAPDTIAEAPVVTGVPMVSDTVWNATYTGAMVDETAGTGWIIVRGRTAAGAAVADMTLATDQAGVVRYLSGGLLHAGTSSPDGEALILNAAAATTMLTVSAGGSGSGTVTGVADATVATILTIP